MFTRIHYKAIAGIIKRNRTRIRIEDVAQLNNGLPCLRPATIGDIADYFEQDNPRFDRDKFMKACGIDLS